jgi:cell pole-organizing protein PopZ
MEEILASIRRIISDDQSLAAHREPARFEPEPVVAQEPRSAPVSPLPPPAAQTQHEQPHANGSAPEAPKASATEERKLFTSLPYMTSPETSPQVAPLERKHMDFADMRLRRQFGETEVRPSAQPAPRHNVEPMPFQPQAPVAKPQQQAVFREDEPIASPATDAAVASSFNALFASRLLPDPETLTGLTRDLLRPMLKAWLDDNLPVMVERLVRAEIERVARGGR